MNNQSVRFLEIIVVSFYCEECGYKNNEVQTGDIQEKGSKIKLRLTNKKVSDQVIVL